MASVLSPSLRLFGSELRKEIRREQLHYESTLRWPLSPHAVRSGFETDEEEEEEEELISGLPAEPGITEIPRGELPEATSPEASSSEAAGETEPGAPSSGATSPRSGKKKKGPAPRMRYSLFHYDMPRHLKRVLPPSPPEKPPEYSSPVAVHTPAWSKLSLTTMEILNYIYPQPLSSYLCTHCNIMYRPLHSMRVLPVGLLY